MDMAILMNTGLSALPPHARDYATGFAAVGGLLPLLEALLPPAVGAFLPSGISVGIGMYLTADLTLPRVAGSVLEGIWRRCDAISHRRYMLVVASGFVLGEGVWSIVALALTVAGRRG